METNLAATQAARKERLIALRKRKEAHESGDQNGAGPYVVLLLLPPSYFVLPSKSPPRG